MAPRIRATVSKPHAQLLLIPGTLATRGGARVCNLRDVSHAAGQLSVTHTTYRKIGRWGREINSRAGPGGGENRKHHRSVVAGTFIRTIL